MPEDNTQKSPINKAGIEISVVIPAYNEENLDEKITKEICDFFSKKGISYEIIVVDDGSEMPATSQFAKIIKLDRNHGKGFAVKTGVLQAVGNYILFLDADHSININHFDLAIDTLKKSGADIAIGSLYQKGSREIQNPPFYRKILGFISRQIIKLFLGLKIKDTQRGFKLFKKESVNLVFNKQKLSGWGFDFEILHIAQKNGFKIVEFPVTFDNPRRKNISPFSYLKSFWELLKVKFFSVFEFYDKSGELNFIDYIIAFVFIILLAIVNYKFIDMFFNLPTITGWDGSGHVAIAKIYAENIFPSLWGWTNNFFAGMPFPLFYPPTLFFIVAAIWNLFPGFDFDFIFKSTVIFIILITPAVFYIVSYKYIKDRFFAIICTLFLTTLLSTGNLEMEEYGLTFGTLVLKGFYAQQIGFLLLLLWLIFIRDIGKRKTPIILSVVVFFGLLLSNAHVILISLSTGFFLILGMYFDEKNIKNLMIRIGVLNSAGMMAAIWYLPMLSHYQFLTGRNLPTRIDYFIEQWFIFIFIIFISLAYFFIRKNYTLFYFGLGLIILFIPAVLRLDGFIDFIPVHINRWYAILIMLGIILIFAFIYNLLKEFNKMLQIPIKILIVLITFIFMVSNLYNYDSRGVYSAIKYDGGKELVEYFKNKIPNSNERYLVEPYFKGEQPFGSTMEAAIGKYGHESGVFILRESSSQVLNMVPVRNSLSSNMEVWGYDSFIATNKNFFGQSFDDAIKRAEKVGITHFVAREKNTIKSLKDMGLEEQKFNLWSVFSFKNSSPKVQILEQKPLLLMANINFKSRNYDEFDWQRFQEEIIYHNRFDIVFAYQKIINIEDLEFDSSKFDSLIISHYKYKDLEKAIENITKISNKNKVVILYSEEDLFIEKLLKLKNKNILITKKIGMDIGLYDKNISTFGKIIEFLKPNQDTTEREERGEVIKENNKIILEEKESAVPVLVRYSYFPDWHRTDGEEIYLATPGYILTFATSSFEMNFETSKYYGFGKIFFAFGLLLMLIISII
jgi:dolichyl-phosphate beta-glucosyltransferase